MNPKRGIAAFAVTLGVLVGVNQLLSVEQPGADQKVPCAADRHRQRATPDRDRRSAMSAGRARTGDFVRTPGPILLQPARAALMLFLAFPTLRFVTAYVWENRGIDGILIAFANHLGDDVIACVTIVADDPFKALAHMAFSSVVTRFALR